MKSISKKRKLWNAVKQNWQLYLLLIPCIVFFVIFNYLPIYGVQIAFRDYKVAFGISGSQWVGLEHFKTFFEAHYFSRLISNTLLLNLYSLLLGFPIPILLALMLNRIRFSRFKKFTQTMIYVPHFISTVVMAGMLYIFLSPTNGIFNTVIQAFGGDPINFMVEPGMFRPIYVLSGVWQDAGWGTILYLAALTGIDQALYEAAEIDGASIWQKIRHIDIPSIVPICAMVFILECGKLMNSNTEKTLLLQTPGNVATSDVLGVYVYNVGLGSAKFSYTAAIGLFINIINFILIISVNQLSKKVSDTGLF